MNLTNKLSLPESIVNAIKSFLREPAIQIDGVETISVTELLTPPQIRNLLKTYGDTLEEDASDRIWSLLGSAVHEILARSDRENAERTLKKSIVTHGFEFLLTGTTDRIAITDDGYTIQDYKVTSVWEVIYGIKPERIAQLNLYRYLLMNELDPFAAVHPEPVHLQVVYLLRDWKLSEARTKPREEYPQSQVVVVSVPVWSYLEAHNFVVRQLERHFFDQVHHCTDEERWARPTTWAVMLKDGKRAARVLPTKEEAEAWMERDIRKAKMTVVERPGRSVRCEDYCPVASVCQQWAAIKEAQRVANPESGQVQPAASDVSD